MEREPLLWMSMFGPFATMYVVLAALLIPFVLYLIARWRAHRDPVVDPQLGLKVALGYFASTTFQVGCAGLALLVYAVIGDLGDDRGTFVRAAFGLIVPSGLLFVAHLAMLSRTNHAQFPSVERLFVGYNLLWSGTVGFVALVLGAEAIFKQGSAGELGKVAGALSLVYGAAWVVLGARLTHASNAIAPPPAPPLAPPPA